MAASRSSAGCLCKTDSSSYGSCRADLDIFVEEPKRIRVPSVTARVVWLLSAQNPWSITRLQQIFDKESTKRETWKVHGHIVCLVWQSGRVRTSIPDGLLTVAFPYVFYNRAGRLSELHIEACLAWVRPQSRGKGIARYLAHPLFCYGRDCPLRYPHVARNGIEIEFIADIYSDAGQVVTSWL